MKDFKIGLHRRIFNKNLKEAIDSRGLNYELLREKTGIDRGRMSQIVNFKLNPDEEKRVKIAVALETPIDELFPEKYDELYNKISPSERNAELKIDFLRLDSSEALALEAPETADEEAIVKEQHEKIENTFTQFLTPKERHILKMRHGLSGGACATLEETAKFFGVTRERIRQIESKALEKLRNTNLKELLK